MICFWNIWKLVIINKIQYPPNPGWDLVVNQPQLIELTLSYLGNLSYKDRFCS